MPRHISQPRQEISKNEHKSKSSTAKVDIELQKLKLQLQIEKCQKKKEFEEKMNILRLAKIQETEISKLKQLLIKIMIRKLKDAVIENVTDIPD